MLYKALFDVIRINPISKLLIWLNELWSYVTFSTCSHHNKQISLTGIAASLYQCLCLAVDENSETGDTADNQADYSKESQRNDNDGNMVYSRANGNEDSHENSHPETENSHSDVTEDSQDDDAQNIQDNDSKDHQAGDQSYSDDIADSQNNEITNSHDEDTADSHADDAEDSHDADNEDSLNGDDEDSKSKDADDSQANDNEERKRRRLNSSHTVEAEAV